MLRFLAVAAVLALTAPAGADGAHDTRDRAHPALDAGLDGAHAAPASDADRAASADPAPARAKPRTKRTPRARTRRHRRHFHPPSFDVTATAAWHYGQLSKEACEAEATARGIPFTSEPTRGVMAGVRLTGPIKGVTFKTRLSEDQRRDTPWEIADCRLVLALDDFADVLAAHDIVEVRHYSMHREAPKSWPPGKIGSQHHGGMAIDAAIFVTRDGTKLDVLKDWHGRIGAATCGPKARPRTPTDHALALRAILCETAAKRIFNVILTPNHNRAHRNHFHLDVTAGAKWFIVD